MKSKIYLLLIVCFLSFTNLFSQTNVTLLNESFEGAFPPLGWTILSSNQTSSYYTWNKTNYKAYALDSLNAMAYYDDYYNKNDGWAITPPVTLNTNTAVITFWVRTLSAGRAENLRFTVGAGNKEADQAAILVDSLGITSATYRKWTVNFNPSAYGTYYFGLNCYSDPGQSGVVIDSFKITQLSPACSGVANGGITVSSSTLACQKQALLLNVTGATAGVAGLTYQWQSSTDSLNWTDMTGFTQPFIIDSVAFTSTTYFRRKTYCGTSFTPSKPVKVTITNPLQCVCSPNTGVTLHTGVGYVNIDSLEIQGTSLKDSILPPPVNGYTYFGNKSINLKQGATYKMITKVDATYSGVTSTWIDYNHDGIMEPREWTRSTRSARTHDTVSIEIPEDAIVGQTIMRLRSYSSPSGDSSDNACTSFYSGETIDYLINITPGDPCTGKPVGGTTLSSWSAATICPNVQFKLSVSGATTGVVNLKYKWQQSTNSGTTWTDFGTDSASYYVTSGITVPTCFRRKIICGGTDSSYSTVLCMGVNSVATCVCGPMTGLQLNQQIIDNYYQIDSVSIRSTTLNASTYRNPQPSYELFDSVIPNLNQSSSYNLFVKFRTFPYRASAWIDWNQDGVFDPSSEYYSLPLIGNSNFSSLNFYVPNNASLGNLIIRIRTSVYGSNACSVGYSGETKDFVVNVNPTTNCLGAPKSGTTTFLANVPTNGNTICPNMGFYLNVAGGASGIANLSYQWQSSTDNGASWNDMGIDSLTTYIPGITSPTCYRRATVCGGNTSYSAPLCLAITPSILCACGPATGLTMAYYPSTIIDTVHILGTKLNIAAPYELPAMYEYFNDVNTIPSLSIGTTYTFHTQLGAKGYSGLWFDWNQDGVFDMYSEYIPLTTGYVTDSIETVQFVVPTTATVGSTLMRVRSSQWDQFGGQYGRTACSKLYYGDTKDFVVNITPGTACSGMPLGGSTSSSSGSSVCSGIPFILSVTGDTKDVINLHYDWQTSTDGTNWTSLGLDSLKYFSSGIVVPTYFRRSITCGTNTAYSSVLFLKLNKAINCMCGPNTGIQLHNGAGSPPTIDSVLIRGPKGVVLAINDSGAPSTGYTMHNTPLIKLSRGLTYTIYPKTSQNYWWGSSPAFAWIDFDQNGTFDNYEYFAPVSANNDSIVFTVPSDAITDTVILRLRVGGNGSLKANDACTSLYGGETEDFRVLVDAGLPCTGQPTGGTTITTTTGMICAGTPFNLDVTGDTRNQAGLTYQWQNSTDGVNFYDIPGETGTKYQNITGDPSPTYYQRVISCTNSGFNDNSIVYFNDFAPYSNFPFFEGFEKIPLAAMYNNYGLGVEPYCWSTVATRGSTFGSIYYTRRNFGARTGSNFTYAKYNSNAFLISPQMALTQGQTYHFWYYYRPTDPIAGYTVKTFVSMNPDTASLKLTQLGTTIIDPIDTSKWSIANYSFTPTVSGNYYFAINASATGKPYYLNIDDINLSLNGLPVILTKFIGEKVGSVNKLTWTTTSEINNKGFEIQRSLDGINFEKIGFVATQADAGTSKYTIHYNFDDKQPSTLNQYYRLRQVDMNGQETFSNIVLIRAAKVENKITFTSIYPNPAKSNLTVNMNVPTIQNINIIVTDISGRMVKEEKLLANSGDNQYSINVDGLPTGTYIIKANCNNGCEAAVQKFVKQ